jgi:hypothetical protein
MMNRRAAVSLTTKSPSRRRPADATGPAGDDRDHAGDLERGCLHLPVVGLPAIDVIGHQSFHSMP